MKQKILNLLGLALKAGKLVTGEDTVVENMRKNKVKLVFLASDASSKTIDKFETKCFYYKVELNMMFNTEELSKSIGKTRKILALTDEGFAKSIKICLGGEINDSKRDN